MRVSDKTDWLGYFQIEEVRVQHKDKLFRPDTGGMRKGGVARILSGSLKDELVLYRKHLKQEINHEGEKFIMIPAGAVLSIIELEDGEEAVDPIIVDKHFGEDREWYSIV